MIPQNIKRKHIVKAIEEINQNGVPKRRESRTLNLIYEGTNYPPKYVVGLANKYTNGQELNPNEFNSGNETIRFLNKLGFDVIDLNDANR